MTIKVDHHIIQGKNQLNFRGIEIVKGFVVNQVKSNRERNGRYFEGYGKPLLGFF